MSTRAESRRVLVTTGPSYEPIDDVRRLTNFSTGETGVLLANALTRAGFDVTCFKGVGATFGQPLLNARLVPFTTNEHLRSELTAVSAPEETAAVFHAAALCDFKVQRITMEGVAHGGPKISSRSGELVLTLAPAVKLIAELRTLFPTGRIVGWKYELAGTREEALDAGAMQMHEARTDACVVNGAAYGAGFGFCERQLPPVHLASKTGLCEFLAEWLVRTAAAPQPTIRPLAC